MAKFHASQFSVSFCRKEKGNGEEKRPEGQLIAWGRKRARQSANGKNKIKNNEETLQAER